ncbi:hypothetical protein P7H22_00225 [Paenibacillus larvae]|nr:hypothetical protein [Paenibacillus larvae]MDT2239139.1 hypothetical protein [Paenibacillus larvae]
MIEKKKELFRGGRIRMIYEKVANDRERIGSFFVLMILVILIIGIFGGTKAREEENKSNSGMYVCSPTGEEINKEMWGTAFSQAGS